MNHPHYDLIRVSKFVTYFSDEIEGFNELEKNVQKTQPDFIHERTPVQVQFHYTPTLTKSKTMQDNLIQGIIYHSYWNYSLDLILPEQVIPFSKSDYLFAYSTKGYDLQPEGFSTLIDKVQRAIAKKVCDKYFQQLESHSTFQDWEDHQKSIH